ncbi:LysR family transcriptional regulator [Actinomadura sp. WMMB 499]|uniref:LysR family transcriptional regulator n=1 Tax=Actinomadura sp. WMMB 499 TaxID=1219491 RepID=UPI0012480798|nr:LysR family transcriptional regulator [Actinomadura sp. WMMB 499]QFG20176.1 LysR family transcriptional regulator [Actinomadura sp. WMMB 499]
MDTHRLKYFLCIAEEGSMTRAANVLGVAQPALSRHVRLLEEDLGVTLFRRTSRGVELTEEGERLRASTAAPLRQLELALLYAGSPLARVERGLRLGLPPTAAGVLAAPLLAALGALFPKVGFHVTVAGTDALVQGMLNGTIDTALINPVADDRLFSRDLLVEDLVVVGGPRSDLRPVRPLEFADLARLPLVLPGSHAGIAGLVENTALRRKVRIDSRFATDSLRVAVDLMEAGLAYGVLPLSACGPELGAGRLRHAPLREPALTQRLGVAATSRLELPRELAHRIGDVIRTQTGLLIASGAWPATFLAPDEWDPNLP